MQSMIKRATHTTVLELLRQAAKNHSPERHEECNYPNNYYGDQVCMPRSTKTVQ